VTLTVRTDEQVFKALAQEASARKVTVNAFVNQILTNHVDWGRHASKFGSVEIPVEGFAGILNLLDEEKIASFGREAAQRRWKNLISLWHGDTSPDSVLKFVIFWLENTGQAKLAYVGEEPHRRVVGFHHLGIKGSIFFKHEIETIFEYAQKKVVVDILPDKFSFRID
jgi:hypothetical protein